MDMGVFIPIGNNGWLISETSPQYKPSFELNKAIVQKAETDRLEVALAGWAKKLTGAATITVGSVELSGEFIAAFGGESSKPASLEGLVRRLENDEFDLVAVGRAILNDPLWVAKVRQGDRAALLDFSPASLAELV